jgi:hypothetical protein
MKGGEGQPMTKSSRRCIVNKASGRFQIVAVILSAILMVLAQGSASAAVFASVDQAELAPNPQGEFTPNASCVPTSTVACVQGNRFSIQVFFSGSSPAFVATSNGESAVFWFYSSLDWEVVAKVINGCPVNNHWWIFGAGATSTSYSLNIIDTATGRSAGYNGAVLCPIEDTGMFFPCP